MIPVKIKVYTQNVATAPKEEEGYLILTPIDDTTIDFRVRNKRSGALIFTIALYTIEFARRMREVSKHIQPTDDCQLEFSSASLLLDNGSLKELLKQLRIL